MAQHASEIATLAPARDDLDRLEGRIWMPTSVLGRASARKSAIRSARRENGDGASNASADVDRMPTISTFYGIVIRMRWGDHLPPHFHVWYGEHRATVGIESGAILQGSLPTTATRLVSEWAAINRDALLEDWMLCSTNQEPKRIPPLS